MPDLPGAEDDNGGPSPDVEKARKAAQDRERLRQFLASLGYNLPVTLTDLNQQGRVLFELQAQIRDAQANLLKNGSGLRNIGSMATLVQRMQNLAQLSDQVSQQGTLFQQYALDFIETQKQKQPGNEPAEPDVAATYVPQLEQMFKQFDKLLRPAMPKIARLPTASEFLSDFNNALDTRLSELSAQGLGSNELEFARRFLSDDLRAEYQGALGTMAKMTGQSPFYLDEVSREQRGIGQGMAAGNALLAATGPGVSSPMLLSAGGPTRIENVPGAGLITTTRLPTTANGSGPSTLGSMAGSDSSGNYTGSYSPQVEAWRGDVTREFMARGLTAADIDKALYVIQGESGGNARAINPNSTARGLVQIMGSHGFSEEQRFDPQFSIKWMADQVKDHGWTDWGGDGALYEGKPYGTLGLSPYPGDSRSGSSGSSGANGSQQSRIRANSPILLGGANQNVNGLPQGLSAGEITSIRGAQAQEGQQSELMRRVLAQEQSIQDAKNMADQIGEGIPREFIALPKIMPLDFLASSLTAARIKTAYEGHSQGAGRTASFNAQARIA